MSRLFILAFGGTGARCAEAFTYLMASGAVKQPCHILIIDPDQGNGNVDQARKQLLRYLEIHRQLQSSAKDDDAPFFGTALNAGEPTFFWSNPSGGSTWSSSLGFATLDENTREFLGCLYDQDDLDLSFEEGYVGRANIGSLDLLRTLRSASEEAMSEANAATADGRVKGPIDSLHHFFRELRSAAQSAEGANLVVIGSIFGGTGASGLPAIPPLLVDRLRSNLRDRINLACIQIAPYFTFPEGAEGDPDSALHPMATQSALQHYAVNDVGYDRIYLIGAPNRPSTSNHPARGGPPQRNDAHYVELSAALAAAHFFESVSGVGGARGTTKLFSGSARQVAWGKLPFEQDVMLRERLVDLAIFAIAHANYFADGLAKDKFSGSPFMHEVSRLNGARLGGHEPVLQQLQEFSNRYLEWINQVQSTTGAALFSLDAPLSDQSVTRITAGGDSGRNPVGLLRTYLDKQAIALGRGREVRQPTAVGFYIQALTKAAKQYRSETYSGWGARS